MTTDSGGTAQPAGHLLLERHGGPGTETITLDLPGGPPGPVIVEAEQPADAHLSVTAKSGFQVMADPLLDSYAQGSAGRAWTFLREGRPTKLRIKAEGAWTVRVRSIDAARSFDSGAAGRGPEVVAYRGGATDAVIVHREEKDELGIGGSLFLWSLPAGAGAQKKDERLVTAGDDVHETVRLPGPCLLFLQTDFDWSITVA